MSAHLPTDGTSAPLICLYGHRAGDHAAAAGLPDDVEVVEIDLVEPIAALCAIARRAPGRDVLLLSRQTRLPLHWWPRLRAALHAGASAGIDVLSPLSNAADAFDPRCDRSSNANDAELAQIDAACWAVSDRALLPIGAWLACCSLWRARALASVRDDAVAGLLPGDLQAVAIDHLYVAVPHREPCTAPAPAGVGVLRSRLAAREATPLPLFGLDGKPVVLHLLHGWGGGAQRFVEDLVSADTERNHLVLVARGEPGRRVFGETLALHADLAAAPFRSWPLSRPVTTTAVQSIEYRAHLQTLINDFGVGAMLVSSLIGHSLDALRCGLPLAVVCHDYYPLWPRLDADFGDPDRDFSNAAIAAALSDAGERLEFGERDASHWIALRHAYVAALEAADAILIAPTDSVQRNLQRIEPALRARRWRKVGHGFAPWARPTVPIRPDPDRAGLRIVVPGRIRGGKGEALIAALLPKLPPGIELILLGAGAAAYRFFGQRGAHVVLDYQREELPELLAALAPDAALLPSTVSETYSYMLSELWSLGVPVIAAARGSMAERIEHGRTGLLFEPDADAAALLTLLVRLLEDRSALATLRAMPRPALPSPAQMAESYRAALPAATIEPAPPTMQFDASAARFEQLAATRAATVGQLQSRLTAQQTELERRADWAVSQQRLAQERERWALRLQRESAERETWLRDLQAESARLAALVVSEQQRLQSAMNAQQHAFDQERGHLVAQRDEFERERNRIVASASWKLTKPLRWLNRQRRALPSRIAFRLRRLLALQHRLVRSLRTRGLGGTLLRIRQEIHPPLPQHDLQIPEAERVDLPLLPRVDAPRASVIVPVYNHFHHTRTCLQALAACGDALPFEVIVVDDGSNDQTQQQLGALDGIIYLRNPRNLGFIGACNAGAGIARGEYLVFLNNDTAVQPGWLDALIGTFATHPDAGLVGAKLVYPDGRLQEAGGIVFSDASGWNYGRFDDPGDPRYNFVREADYCSGAAIAIGRKLFERFGGFDPFYAPAYYEDTDLAMKVRGAGLRVLYQPASVVVHFEGITSGTDTGGSGTKRYQLVNQSKFLQRWRDTLASHPASGSDISLARQHRALRHVLIIDATTPQPDHDSGSLRLVNTMRVMRDAGCAITFFADNRAWVDRYSSDLQQLGVEVLWHPWLHDVVGWFADHGKRFDLVFISRHYIASSYVGLVRLHAPQARLVFDTVDLHYLREQREAELSGRADLAHAADVTRSKELALIRSCDITLVVSPVEQALLSREAPGARVDVLSNVHEVFGRRRGFSERRDLMFMGGYQHPPNVDAVVWFVREIFPQVRAHLPDVRFHIIGSKATEAVRALGEVDGVVFHGFVPEVESMLDGIRLAVAPLRFGAGVKGKVNMSMSYGQPVVATPIAVEGMHAEAGRDVLVAEDASAFAEAIVRAYEDEALWTSLSDHGLENVRRHFSFDAALASVRRLFE